MPKDKQYEALRPDFREFPKPDAPSSFFVEVSAPQVHENYLIEPSIFVDSAKDQYTGRVEGSTTLKGGAIRPAQSRASAATTLNGLHEIPEGQARVKRAIDIIGSLSAIIVLLPLWLVIVTMLIFQKGPALFAQERIGKGGKMFYCYKFRTMRVGADKRLAEVLARDEGVREEWTEQRKLTKDPRITRLGQFLRVTSLDEIPQLFNILKGDMSLVGPRPIVRDELSKYLGFYSYYLSVRPGLTGLWQVSGRSNTTYARRVALDVAYVKNYSLAFDALIIARTVPALLRAEGSY